MNSLKGVIAAAATPVKDDLTIDLDHLVRHCAWLLEDGGCDGVNLLGTTGEATSFSAEQRIAAMRAVAASGLPLSRFMVGTGAAAFDDACRLTSEAKALGLRRRAAAAALLLQGHRRRSARRLCERAGRPRRRRRPVALPLPFSRQFRRALYRRCGRPAARCLPGYAEGAEGQLRRSRLLRRPCEKPAGLRRLPERGRLDRPRRRTRLRRLHLGHRQCDRSVRPARVLGQVGEPSGRRGLPRLCASAPKSRNFRSSPRSRRRSRCSPATMAGGA